MRFKHATDSPYHLGNKHCSTDIDHNNMFVSGDERIFRKLYCMQNVKLSYLFYNVL